MIEKVKENLDKNYYVQDLSKKKIFFRQSDFNRMKKVDFGFKKSTIEELNKEEHTPETEEYGISSFVYRTKKPFDPSRFWNFVQHQFPNNVIRSKGLFWLASRPEQALIWGQAGGSLKADSAGVWWSSMPFDKRIRQMAFIENQAEIEKDWDITIGDRKNEIVLIGQNMDETLLRSLMDACLATDLELATKAWKEGYQDSWPVERAYAI